jgi:hypothetical protein
VFQKSSSDKGDLPTSKSGGITTGRRLVVQEVADMVMYLLLLLCEDNTLTYICEEEGGKNTTTERGDANADHHHDGRSLTDDGRTLYATTTCKMTALLKRGHSGC